jgi:hypothetical protein
MFPGLKFTLNSSDPSLVTPFHVTKCYFGIDTIPRLTIFFVSFSHRWITVNVFLLICVLLPNKHLCREWDLPSCEPAFSARFVSLKIESTFVHVNPTFRYFIGVPLGVKLPPVYFSYTRFYKSSHNKYQLFYCVTNSRALILLNWKQHTLCRC